LQLSAQCEEDEAIREDEPGEPGHEQEDRRRGREQAEQPIAGRTHLGSSGRARRPPRAPDEISTEPKPTGRWARDDDRLEHIPEHERQKE
jgi:hypothetical protein